MTAPKIAEKCCASWFAGGSYVHLVEAAVAEGIREGLESAAIMVHEESIRADRDEGHPGAALRRVLAAIRAAMEKVGR